MAAFSTLQVVVARLTGAAVSIDDVRETLALPRYLHAGLLSVHCAVLRACTGYRGEQERPRSKILLRYGQYCKQYSGCFYHNIVH